MTEIESTASGLSTDDKTPTIQYKPVTSLAGNKMRLLIMNSHVASIIDCKPREVYNLCFDQISHALSNIHGLYGCSCNLLDVISIYSLNPDKLPGRFSYERPGYEAR